MMMNLNTESKLRLNHLSKLIQETKSNTELNLIYK